MQQERRLEGRIVLQQVEAGEDEGVAPTLGPHFDDVDDQRVARLGAAYGDRPADLVDQAEVEVEQSVGGRLRG